MTPAEEWLMERFEDELLTGEYHRRVTVQPVACIKDDELFHDMWVDSCDLCNRAEYVDWVDTTKPYPL